MTNSLSNEILLRACECENEMLRGVLDFKEKMTRELGEGELRNEELHH
jgi:hypothetical protein